MSLAYDRRWDREAPTSRPGVPPWTEWTPSPYHSGRGKASIIAIVYHFTAGPRLDGTVRYFTNNDRQVSSHYVVGKDGRTVQMVALDRASHHAGKGQLPGTTAVNASSIGIEIVNWGRLRRHPSGFLTHSSKRYEGPTPVKGPDPSGRTEFWEPFTNAQYEALARLTRDLVAMFPGIKYLTGHQDVAVPYGRKNDPGGAFDWGRIRAAVPSFRGHVGPLRGASSPPPPAPTPPPAGSAPPSSASSVAAKNRKYAETLGWGPRYDDIVRVLGFTNMTPGEDLFAEALAKWQRSRGLVGDGVLGPRTWAALRPLVQNETPHLTTTLASPPGGLAGRALTVNAPGLEPVSYRFVLADADWLGRMLIGEARGTDTPENHAVVWAMFNRYALLICQSKYRSVYPTFHQFIRAYSTPLQPCLSSAKAAARHYGQPGSDYVPCAGKGNYAGTSIPVGQLRRHLELQKRSWNTFPASVQTVVSNALTGRLPNPIGTATEFANTAIYYRQNHGLPLRDASRPTPAEWRDYTMRFAAAKNWEWIGPVPGLSEASQMRVNAFFRQLKLRRVPAGAVSVRA